MADFDADAKAYEEFLNQKGIKLSPKVRIADLRSQNQGRGVVAIEDISEGETIFSIPRSAMLQFESDPTLAELVAKYELDSWSALIVRMMSCYATEEWAPYFAVLPTEFNTPMFWDEIETQKLLQGSAVVTKIDREGADEVYDSLKFGILTEPFFEHSDTSRDTFHRMGSLIMSYGFDVPASFYEDDEEDEGSKAMIPLADTLNSHTKLQNARLTIPETSDADFEMVASKPIGSGEQIYNIYGNQPSSDMLRRYGFVETGGTDFEAVELSLALVVNTAVNYLKTSSSEIEKRLARVEKYIDEIPNSFEIGLSVEEDDGSPEVEFEPELLFVINGIVLSDLKKPQFKKIAELSENEKLLPKAIKLMLAILNARKAIYPSGPPVTSASNKEKVLLSKENMCAQVLQSELKVLDMAIDWTQSFEYPPAKKQKTN